VNETSARAISWRDRDGNPIACREKLKMLEENRAELAQALQDAFEDAILMGVDEAQIRGVLGDLLQGVRSPHG